MTNIPRQRTRVALKHPDVLPPLLPVPELDCHVIAGGEDEGLCGVDDDGADIVGMRLERRNLLAGVVVVYPNLAEGPCQPPCFPVLSALQVDSQVIRSADNPVLPRHESAGADRHIGELKGLDDLLRLVRPDIDMAAIEGGYCAQRSAYRVFPHTSHSGRHTQDPWLGRMEVNPLDTLYRDGGEQWPLGGRIDGGRRNGKDKPRSEQTTGAVF